VTILDRPVTFHKFQLGQLVTVRPALGSNVTSDVFRVTKQLPESRGEFEYALRALTNCMSALRGKAS
jgi:hypothetical protein